MQLDLFAHSRDVMLRNDLLAALRSRDAPASEHALAALAAEFPHDPALAPARLLAGRLSPDIPPFPTHADALQTIARLERETRPAAASLFGEQQAERWLHPAWHALAHAAAHLPYHPDAPEAHAAPLFLRARHWCEAEHHASAIESWRRIPHPLAWTAEARFHLHGLDTAWPLLAELAWLDAVRFGDLARRLPSKALTGLLLQYEREFADTPADHAWFPAWALLDHPELRTVLQTATTPQRTPQEEACRTLIRLLALERQGRHADIVEERKRLRALNGELFGLYMQTRT
ncbi:hypothetical protein [Pseudothauera rhizosphaerae]|uniref:Uncharacterized protein n=1 Tax=Pseudothauera rhizosphaerae TaxID=2565932 RepID=A0A4S4AMH0_9RHOO|nr:hypothetical protein [Pseudothauera rhizosphaerae]THF60813.1 hypothetical protein E6O51_11240 [Pseudothauera rhizosphaerae]